MFIYLRVVIYFVGTLILVISLSVAGFIFLVGLGIFCHRRRLRIIKENKKRLAKNKPPPKRGNAYGSPGGSSSGSRGGYGARTAGSARSWQRGSTPLSKYAYRKTYSY